MKKLVYRIFELLEKEVKVECSYSSDYNDAYNDASERTFIVRKPHESEDFDSFEEAVTYLSNLEYDNNFTILPILIKQ